MMTAQPMPIALLEWRPLRKNSLLGFARIRLGASMIIEEVPINTSHGRRWASLPSKPWVQSDGTVKKDQNGKTVYIPIIRWIDKEAQDRFSEGVINAITREHPGALDA